jgi:hypothetical protein
MTSLFERCVKADTRKEAYEFALAAGLQAEAAEKLASIGASHRAALRVARVVETLRSASASAGENPEPLMGTLALMDEFGVGGSDGLGGESTARIPALQGLGKGRKQARDGAAWSAAIKSARHEICQGRTLRLCPSNCCATGDVGLDMRFDRDDQYVWCRAEDFPAAWLRRLAWEGLRRAIGDERAESVPGVSFFDSTPIWGSLYNRACELLRAEELAAQVALAARVEGKA